VSSFDDSKGARRPGMKLFLKALENVAIKYKFDFPGLFSN
jgi:hypothetical protein